MLSTLLNQLTGYFTRETILGSFMPLLAFACLNGLLAFLLFEEWREFVLERLLAAGFAHSALLIAAGTVALLLLSYVFSSLAPLLRRVLEQGVDPGGWFQAIHSKRRDDIRAELEEYVTQSADLKAAEEWKAELWEAQRSGRANHPNHREAPPAPDDVKRLKDECASLRNAFRRIRSETLEEFFDKLKPRLESCDVDVNKHLETAQTEFETSLAYAIAWNAAAYTRTRNELASNFGDEGVAATRMGNIANTPQSYALRRYNCNLAGIWSNLQRVVEKDAAGKAALREAKTQLDFLIACCWLSPLSALAWAIVFAFVAQSRIGFIAAMLLGPVVAYIWYRIAAEHYRSFADTIMTTFDSFRLALLTEMHVAPPSDVEEERAIWQNIDRLAWNDVRAGNFRFHRAGGLK